MRTHTNRGPTCQPHGSKLAFQIRDAAFAARAASSTQVTMAKTSSLKRSAGLDVGESRIGVAVSDALGLTAQPLGVVQRRSAKAAIAAIMDLLAEYDIGTFVAGLPLHMDGSEGTQADRVRHFCAGLEAQTGIAVLFQDERLDRKSTRLNSSHIPLSRMPSSA